ncbi:unnamed protein product [Ixodes persulcatus]
MVMCIYVCSYNMYTSSTGDRTALCWCWSLARQRLGMSLSAVECKLYFSKQEQPNVLLHILFCLALPVCNVPSPECVHFKLLGLLYCTFSAVLSGIRTSFSLFIKALFFTAIATIPSDVKRHEDGASSTSF